ncbi:MAG TPA: type II toxin-antitoxin system VapC family toxin [Candidatus Saccharimonadales bacterium]|nr:type II toxin-antitoxin system VapC family toxin [Candidatus Saccharimonadales bacterium]
MTLFVLDASVAVKWFLSPKNERLTAEALELLRRYVQKEVQFIIPDLFWAEIASAFWKAVRLGRFEKTSAQQALCYLGRCDLPIYSSVTLLDRTFEIATAFDRSVYDSLYVALAVQTKSQLITADERLANSLASCFPVKWLGAV